MRFNPVLRRRAGGVRRRQRGQALIYGIFMLMAGLASLFFLFNTGQLTREKTKLVNTTDAVAYAAGVMHARALNMDAYANRALVANEVLVAQMVSLSSWAQYASKHIETIPSVGNFFMCSEPIETYYLPWNGFYWVAAAAGAEYSAACNVLADQSLGVGQEIREVANEIPDIVKGVVDLVEVSKEAIRIAQRTMHSGMPIARSRVMRDVAETNYHNDGRIEVDDGVPSALTSDWDTFTASYSNDDRARFAEVTRLAAYGERTGDAFVRSRSWTASQMTPTDWQCFAGWNRNEVRRRGGTELVNYDEWKAEDTVSYHSYAGGFSRWGAPRCRHHEEALGWGEQQAHPDNADRNESEASLGGSPSTNPEAHDNASSSAWTNYSGLPSFYELSSDMLAKNSNLDKENAALLRFTVRLRRRTSETVTSQGRSAVRNTPRINAYGADAAGGVFSQIATSEVYFRRPPAQSNNSHGETLGRPVELGSLFNPYWQVRMVVPPTSDFVRATLMQGSAGF